jgi:carbonic anhydrase/acetyltransferase-like protein (isoleucine patch superfamily)
MMGRKYKLLRGEIIADPFFLDRVLKIYRIKALRDIPEHRVQKGDIGGYVTDKMTLSQQGECWIADNAIVHGASVTGNAIVRDDAIVYAGTETTSETTKKHFRMMREIRPDTKESSLARITLEDKVQVSGNVKITAFSVSESYINPVRIKGNASIFGEAQLKSPAVIEGNAVISGNAAIGVKSRILENAHIFGNAVFGQEVTVAGATIIAGDVSVGNNSMVFGKLFLAGNIKVAQHTKITHTEYLYLTGDFHIEPGNKKLNTQSTTGDAKKDAINSMLEEVRRPRTIPKTITGRTNPNMVSTMAVIPQINSAKMAKYKQLLQETLESLNSYETDIVKIIKYPVMVDRADDYTASMLSAKRAVSLIDPDAEESEFYTAVLAFDKAFYAAEAHALKISTSFLKPDEQKKTRNAQDLFSIAVNAASTENEKVNAVKQGFKQLEGIILVPEQAIIALRAKAGIAELEA